MTAMKKIFSRIAVLAVGLLVLTSCGTIRKSSVTTAEVQTTVVQYPTVTDLEILPKIEKTIAWQWNPFQSDNVNLKKTNLMYDVLKEAGADVLLEPQYNYTKVPFLERRLTITGYPAKFKNFRKATDADIDALKATYTSESGEPKTIYNIAKRPSTRKRFLGIL